ncbi:bifunctional oligoribonuclease/PAP phosphatase NrnA [Sulfuricurvum sp.]|uniref:DHH family phosphoesterase n=1 Tax=Sulfuricurvum sp. TaxID=2025608 RepID=UPI00356B12B0
MHLSLINSARHIVLIVHENPDADSLGSACAFYSYLLRTHKKITLFCSSESINQNLAFLPWFDKLTNRFSDDADLLISFDCSSVERLGIKSSLNLINIDHHRSNNNFGTINLVNLNAISTTEVVYDFFVANDIKINGKMALSLYAGLMDDSKCFSAPICNAKTFLMAHELIVLGADHALCIEWMMRRRSLASVRLRGRLLKEMQLFSEGALALFEVSTHHLEQSGASLGECKRVLEEALELRTVRAALLRVEHPLGGVKISLRTDGTVDASHIMSHFGGGGHASRAGARIETDSQTLFDEMIRMITKELV